MPDDEKRPLKVFLCHAREDQAKAHELYLYLKKQGLQPWLDKENLLPGQKWEEEIPQAIETADAIIICLSKVAVSKEGFVQREFKLALDKAIGMPEGRIFVIPARLEECDVPRSLSSYQWVDLFDEGGYEKLMKSLKVRAEQLQRSNVQIFKKEKTMLRKLKPEYIVTIITAAATIIAGIFSSPWLIVPTPPTPVLSSSATISDTEPLTATFTALHPSETPEPSLMPTKAITPTLPSEITDVRDIKMVFVPAGQFTMGNDSELPIMKFAHIVRLSSYYIDKYEVTNKSYKDCVDAQVCQDPVQRNSNKQVEYYENPSFDSYPVIFVTWVMADKYCRMWREAQLPTEAQWEMAAAGTDDGTAKRMFPWVGQKPIREYANYNGYKNDPQPVDSYPLGVSPYKAFNMAGNVWEWVNDSFNPDRPAYPDPPGVLNPKGAALGGFKIIRGGGWDSYDLLFLRVDFRGYQLQDVFRENLGFRCAISVP